MSLKTLSRIAVAVSLCAVSLNMYVMGRLHAENKSESSNTSI